MTALNTGSLWAWAVLTLASASLLVRGVVLLRRSQTVGSARPEPAAGPPTARDILADRLSRGEIGEAEYQARMRVLDER